MTETRSRGDLTATVLQVILYILEHPGCTVPEVAAALGIAERTCRDIVSDITPEIGVVTKVKWRMTFAPSPFMIRLATRVKDK